MPIVDLRGRVQDSSGNKRSAQLNGANIRDTLILLQGGKVAAKHNHYNPNNRD